MLCEIRYHRKSSQTFCGFPLTVPRMLTVWPTYDGYVKDDYEVATRHELDYRCEELWGRIVAGAIRNLCSEGRLYETTLHHVQAPWYWFRTPKKRFWKISRVRLQEKYLQTREHTGHECVVHLIGPRPLAQADFKSDQPPIECWMNEGFACLQLGTEEPVLFSYWPDESRFLEQLARSARSHGHELVESKRPFLSHWATASQKGELPNYSG